MKILEIKNITYRANNTDILRGISLDINKGDFKVEFLLL